MASYLNDETPAETISRLNMTLDATRQRETEKKARITALEAQLAEAERVKEHLLVQAQCHAMEARSQRSTVNEVGSLLGGVGDWGPIVKGVAAMKEKLAERDAEVGRMQTALRAVLKSVKQGAMTSCAPSAINTLREVRLALTPKPKEPTDG